MAMAWPGVVAVVVLLVLLIREAVCSVRERCLSTQRTAALASARRMAVAEPLPSSFFEPWLPAPATMDTLLRR
jgi:hypothetical protein